MTDKTLMGLSLQEKETDEIIQILPFHENKHLNKVLEIAIKRVQEKHPSVKVIAHEDLGTEEWEPRHQVVYWDMSEDESFQKAFRLIMEQQIEMPVILNKACDALKEEVERNNIEQLSLEDLKRYAQQTLEIEAHHLTQEIGALFDDDHNSFGEKVHRDWEGVNMAGLKVPSIKTEIAKYVSDEIRTLEEINPEYLNNDGQAMLQLFNGLRRNKDVRLISKEKLDELENHLWLQAGYNQQAQVKTVFEQPVLMVVEDHSNMDKPRAIKESWMADDPVDDKTTYASLGMVLNQRLEEARGKYDDQTFYNGNSLSINNDDSIKALAKWNQNKIKGLANNALTRLMIQYGLNMESLLDAQQFKQFGKNLDIYDLCSVENINIALSEMDIRPIDGAYEESTNDTTQILYHTYMSFGDALTLNMAAAILSGKVNGLSPKLLANHTNDVVTIYNLEMQFVNDENGHCSQLADVPRVDILLSNISVLNSKCKNLVTLAEGKLRYHHMQDTIGKLNPYRGAIVSSIFGGRNDWQNKVQTNPIIAEQLRDSAATFIDDFSMEKLQQVLENNQKNQNTHSSAPLNQFN